jgi:uncharacterized protein YbbC (DUF1343 family)
MKEDTNQKRKYITSYFHVFFILCIALLLPRFFFRHTTQTIAVNDHTAEFKLGVENLNGHFLDAIKEAAQKKAPCPVGLVTNHCGIDQKGCRTIDILLEKGFLVKKIFIPEDDIGGEQKSAAMIMKDTITGIPLVMLPRVDSLKNSCRYPFDDMQMLFLDLQDTGICPNIYILALIKTLYDAAKRNKTVIVLDRPNVLGSTMEGIMAGCAEYNNEMLQLPMRHGMTFGELASYFNELFLGGKASLQVVPMYAYNRAAFLEAPILCPLLTNIDTCYDASFLNILSTVYPFDIGIGTDMAFQCVALPEFMHFSKQKWFQLRALLKDQHIETTWHRYYNPRKKCSYAGLRLIVKNVEEFSPFNTLVTIITFFKQAGVPLRFCQAFDRLCGGIKMRDFLEGNYSCHDLKDEVNKELKNFFAKAQNFFIYKPLPKLMLL